MLRILLTNDDGYLAPGLEALEKVLSARYDVVVAAPDRERSGSSHSITLHHPLRARRIGDQRYAVDGTPTDCVNIALHLLLAEEPPDLVISGINLGFNLGDDVTYSGTVGAAIEASLLGYPAIALSQGYDGDEVSLEATARLGGALVDAIVEDGLEPDLLLNVNFPTGEVKGFEVTRLSRRRYRDVVVEKTDPRGQAYYWIAGTPEWEGGEGTDQEALSRGFASVTPLQLDLTDFKRLGDTDPLVKSLRQLGQLEEDR